MKVERTPRPLSLTERRTAFTEVVRNFTEAEAVYEAHRCLYCYDAPCIQGCPAGIDIPGFISRIRTGNFLGSAELIYEANPFGTVCGRVCPTESLCEKACTTRLLNVPVAIGYLQRFVCDLALARNRVSFLYPPISGKNIAVVGGGPSGLSCAHYLRKKGHRVTIFEQEESLGGLLRSAIPHYRLPAEKAKLEVERLAEGLSWKRIQVRKKEAEQILKEFDAVFLGLGLGESVSLGIEGENLPGVIFANKFLADLTKNRSDLYPFAGKEIAVVGGGPTAMDAARSAIRLQAMRATVLYRRTQDELPAFPSEYEAALEEGVQFLWLVAPLKVERRADRLRIRLERMALGEPDASGRRTPRGTGSFFEMEVDFLLVAIATRPLAQALEAWPGLTLNERQIPLSQDGQSSIPKVFLGGDLSGGGTVVKAVAEGKKAAEKIDSWLKKEGTR